MSAARSHFGRRRLGLASLLVLVSTAAVTGCGSTHKQTAVSPRATIVGVNVNAAPGAPVVVNDSPNVVNVDPPAAVTGAGRATFEAGEKVVEQSGCLGCHEIGADGNNGPGSPLTHIGARLSRAQIIQTIVNPTAPMPSFSGLRRSKLRALATFLADLR